MASYFRQVPNFEYVSRAPGAKISDYQTTKNLFKRGKLRDDIFGDLTFFTKYQIVGDDRPDNVAYEVYGDATLDWVILLSNNIIHVQDEWPMSQMGFYNYLIEKYGSEEAINNIHHYESIDVRATDGTIIIPEGEEIPNTRYDYRSVLIDGTTNSTFRQEVPYFVEYYDAVLGTEVLRTNITTPITNYVYEDRLQNEKRNIFVLKPEYLNVIFNDMEDMMKYKKGSTQYVSTTLKKGENIRLYPT